MQAVPPRRGARDPSIRWVRLFQAWIRVSLGLLPLVAIGYLHWFQDAALLFSSHLFHVLAIALSTLLSAFVTYVTWVCYRSTGEVFLRWLVLGLLGFTVLYAPHGALTRLADNHLQLFIIFGPVSRLLMAGCFLSAVLRSDLPDEPPQLRGAAAFWAGGALFILLVGGFAGVLAVQWTEAANLARILLEVAALLACVLGLMGLHARRTRSPLMMAYMFSLALFAESSLAFLLANPWNHQWWLAHGIFALGFFVLSYGVTQAFLTTRSFATAYSQEEMVDHLRREKERADAAVVELEEANRRLLTMATTDPLTGAANRRQYKDRVVVEMARAQRKGFSLALLALDLDYFKQINDRYGHLAGDAVLTSFVREMHQVVRPSDLIARTGGEEFRILLPDTGLEESVVIAERIRARVAAMTVDTDQGQVRFTVSIGCALLIGDMGMTESVADERLYRAKSQGRNRVVWRDPA